jgi:hypothetical protein
MLPIWEWFFLPVYLLLARLKQSSYWNGKLRFGTYLGCDKTTLISPACRIWFLKWKSTLYRIKYNDNCGLKNNSST